MRKPGGWSFITDPSGHVEEQETFTCSHCNKVVFVKARQDPADAGGLCYSCNGLICKECVGKDCTPFKEKLYRQMLRAEALRSYGG